MNIVKKMSVGGWIAVAAAVCTLVSLIVYAVNIGGAGYFQGSSVSNLVPLSILAIVLLVGAVALALFRMSGSAGMAMDVVSGAAQIIAPALLALCLINLIAARAEGLGFIYFSNADVILEVQTPANMASATGAIANMVCLGVSMLVGIVAAFCTLRKKD